MKKILSLLILSVLLLTSCWTKKFEELPVEKQDEIVKKVETKREEMIEKIDMSDYTDESKLTEENLAKLKKQIEDINKNVIEEAKSENKWVDFSILEQRLSTDVNDVIKK